MKRLFDLLLAAAALVLLMPALALITLLVMLDSAGSPIYAANRIGKGGLPFKMFKFRTMMDGADRAGPLVTAGGDPRITRLGRLLRRTKLDELPSLWNVVIGEMSLVGPRPENPLSAQLYTAAQRQIWNVRPGITSWASVEYRNEEALLAGAHDLDAAYYEIMQAKLQLDLKYVTQPSLRTDLHILLATARATLNFRVNNAD